MWKCVEVGHAGAACGYEQWLSRETEKGRMVLLYTLAIEAAGDKSLSTEVAKSVVQQISSQIGLVISLSLSIYGGLLILMQHATMHNHDHADDKKPIRFQWPMLIMLVLAFEGLAILCGLLAVGFLSGSIPAIYNTDFRSVDNLTDVHFAGHVQIKASAGLQLLLFFLGIATLSTFLVVNKNIWRGKQ
jgi:hypothetical protein